jgi:F-type H+-transporting ATPase subunit b
MLIDWFTVIAQLLNFLLLVWLFQRFLYRPILKAIDAREKDIAAKLTDAEAKQTEALKEHEEFDNKNKAFDDQRNAIMAKATGDAKAEHDRLVEDAHKEAQGLRASEAAALKNDQVHLGVAIKRMAQDQVFSVARKTLTDLATVSLEERIGEVFTRRLRQMDGKGRDELGAALKSSPEASLVRSAFDLPAQQKDAIQNALNETFSSAIRLRYEVDANAIGGIELTANGQKLSWSISSYLDTFDESLGKLLNTQAETGPKPPATTSAEAVSESASVAQ